MLTWQEQHDIEQAVYPAYTERAYGEMRQRLAAALTAGAAVLDAGSGPGTWLLRRHYADIHVAGLDLFRPQPLPVGHYAIGSLDAIPYQSALFDVVLCYDVVEHLAQPRQTFAEFWRVLKPGGLCVVKTPNLYGPSTLAAAVLPHAAHLAVHRGLGTREGSVFPTLFRCNTQASLALTLAASGFVTEALYTVDETAGYFAFVPWSYALALRYSRLLAHPALALLRSGLIGFFRKPPLAPALNSGTMRSP